jgi:membrane-associated phospholipid phosphatase
MHLAWALLVAMNARRRELQIAFWSYVVLLAISTIGLGQHYVVDLLAAIPYAAASQKVARWVPSLGIAKLPPARKRKPLAPEASKREGQS